MISDEIKKELERQLEKLSYDLEEDATIDYLVLDITKWEIKPKDYEYYTEYDQYGGVEERELIIESDIPRNKYMFDSRLLKSSESSYFINNIDKIITCRDKVERSYNAIVDWAEEVSEIYNQKASAQFAQYVFDFAQGKRKRLFYKNEDDYNERSIESNLQEGLLVLDAEDALKLDVFDDWKDSGDIFYYPEVDYHNLKTLIIESLSHYYELDLLYPLNYYDLFYYTTEAQQNTENQNMKMIKNTETIVSEALKGNRFYVRQTLTSNYEGTDTPIIYLSLTELYKDQDYLVLSEACAREFLSKENDNEKKDYLSKCEVTYSEEAGCYGIVRPSTSKIIAEYVF